LCHKACFIRMETDTWACVSFQIDLCSKSHCFITLLNQQDSKRTDSWFITLLKKTARRQSLFPLEMWNELLVEANQYVIFLSYQEFRFLVIPLSWQHSSDLLAVLRVQGLGPVTYGIVTIQLQTRGTREKETYLV
jgi:hypothetical protein